MLIRRKRLDHELGNAEDLLPDGPGSVKRPLLLGTLPGIGSSVPDSYLIRVEQVLAPLIVAAPQQRHQVAAGVQN